MPTYLPKLKRNSVPKVRIIKPIEKTIAPISQPINPSILIFLPNLSKPSVIGIKTKKIKRIAAATTNIATTILPRSSISYNLSPKIKRNTKTTIPITIKPKSKLVIVSPIKKLIEFIRSIISF